MKNIFIIGICLIFLYFIYNEYFTKKTLEFKSCNLKVAYMNLDSSTHNCYISYEKHNTISNLRELYSRNIGPKQTIDSIIEYIKLLDYKNNGYIITFSEDIISITYVKIDVTDYNYIRHYFKWNEVKYSIKTQKTDQNVIKIYSIPNNIKLLDLYGG